MRHPVLPTAEPAHSWFKKASSRKLLTHLSNPSQRYFRLGMAAAEHLIASTNRVDHMKAKDIMDILESTFGEELGCGRESAQNEVHKKDADADPLELLADGSNDVSVVT